MDGQLPRRFPRKKRSTVRPPNAVTATGNKGLRFSRSCHHQRSHPIAQACCVGRSILIQPSRDKQLNSCPGYRRTHTSLVNFPIQAVVRFHLVEAISRKAEKMLILGRQMSAHLSYAQALTAHLSTAHHSSSNGEFTRRARSALTSQTRAAARARATDG